MSEVSSVVICSNRGVISLAIEGGIGALVVRILFFILSGLIGRLESLAKDARTVVRQRCCRKKKISVSSYNVPVYQQMKLTSSCLML